MSKMLRSCSLLLAVAGCLALQPALAEEGATGNLVNANWLERHLKDAGLVILDASPGQMYAANHIPGAVSVEMLNYGVAETPVAEMEKLYQSWGVGLGKRIVCYDQGGSMMATRVFYSLYYHGFPVKDLFLLDGGLSKWQEKGLPVTKEVTTAATPGNFRIGKTNEDARVRLPEFLNASGDPANHALLEALGANWHFGEVMAFNRAGHVPNGILLPSADYYNPDKTFKSADEIRKMVTYVGIRPEQEILTYCGGGVAASVPWFALRFIVGYPKVRMYVESELGWLSDERELPYWTYDAPYLMRESSWLQFWGGLRIRSIGMNRVSVVDLRPRETFQQGHVPFALNVPADVFRSNVGSPEKLAAVLGPAGVDADHEAVVVSGAGLTKEAALAFAMLEKLGQRRVSVLMDSMDKWGQAGFAVSKEATVVGPTKNRQDLSVAPTSYPASSRKDVMIADPKSTEGIYPKVFIASGKDVPGKTPEGKVVHVAYSDLVSADGRPKAAKEIWNVLVKAGVPRYAELVCFAEDPGEAAMNYFVLKVMGYPDVKVLVM